MFKHLIFILIPSLVFSQIKIDLREKKDADILGNINYKSNTSPNNGFKIYTSDRDYSSGFKELNTGIFYLGSNEMIVYDNKTKLVTVNLSGDITFYDLPTGKTIRHIPFNKMNFDILNSSANNKNCLFTNLSITDNEQYLIFKTFDLNGSNDKYIDYFILNIKDIESTNFQPKVVSLYNFENTELINENKILNNTLLSNQNKTLKKIQTLVSSDKQVNLNKKFDGVYFTAKNMVPIKFVQLGDETYFEAAEFFNNKKNELFVSPQRYAKNYNYTKDFKKLNTLVSDENNLNTLIENKNGHYALFSTSYGSKHNAILIKIDDLLENTDLLYENARQKINDYYKNEIISDKLNVLELENDKLHIKFEDNKYYFIGSWLQQANFSNKDLKVFGNSYEWKYYKNINELNELKLNKPILLKNNSVYNFNFYGWKNNTFYIYNSNIRSILNFEKPITDEQLKLKNTLRKEINFNELLPKLENSDLVLETKPSQDIGKRFCEICAGTGFIAGELYPNYVYFNGKHYKTWERRKCFNCSGKGHYTLVTGDYEKKKIIRYDKWSLKSFNHCSNDEFLAVFESYKKTYLQETRGGYLTKGNLESKEKLTYSFIIDKSGKIKESKNSIIEKLELCGQYHPIVK